MRTILISAAIASLSFNALLLPSRVGASANTRALSPIVSLLLDGDEPGSAVTRPSYRDGANIPELSGSMYGAMGDHPVRKVSMDSPWPDYADNNDMRIDLYFPSDISGKRPTVFFISGWHVYHSERYRSFLYFIASQGFNAVFIPYLDVDPMGNPDLLLTILDGVAAGPWEDRIDTSKVGFAGHSMGAGLVFYLAQQRSNWGTQGRFLFPMAAWWGFHLQPTGDYQLPANTNLIVQVNHDDSGTDPRQNIDFLLHNNVDATRKTYLYLPGDANHVSNHGVSYSVEENGVYYHDALDQVGLHRPLESLMRYSFEGDTQWKSIGLPDAGDANYDTFYSVNSISVLSTDDPMANHDIPIPAEQDLDTSFLCSKQPTNPRWKMCMPCKDSSRDQAWHQCQ